MDFIVTAADEMGLQKCQHRENSSGMPLIYFPLLHKSADIHLEAHFDI